ncbi:hypothetical protein MNBD_GAMMA22-2979 [hydrothermal vent metagenome]|uniref:Uncharacterized protein n=1 Tax=hydrothermal vent metagenome TaxID=652676 RepID=A0A3B1AM73_9ZZZZ
MTDLIIKKTQFSLKLTPLLISKVAALTCSLLVFNIGVANERKLEDFKHSNFDENSINIDNKWWPLSPGKQLIYDGETVEDGKSIPHKIIFTVTDLTKVINGVNTVVVWDRDFSKGKLEESELAFFAQDKNGNVWHLGQYREIYENEGLELLGGRAWLANHLQGAKAGIMMHASPKLSKQSYSQGYAPPPFNWTDRARVIKTGQKTTVKAGSYKDVLVVEEYNEEEPNALQLKYYAKGVGNVRVGWSGDDHSKETLELSKVVYLKNKDLAYVRKEAMKLEERNYIYGHTQRAMRRD